MADPQLWPRRCIIVYSSLCHVTAHSVFPRSLLKWAALPALFSGGARCSSSYVPPLAWRSVEAVLFGFAYACPIFRQLWQLNVHAKPLCPSWFYQKQLHISASIMSGTLTEVNIQHRQPLHEGWPENALKMQLRLPWSGWALITSTNHVFPQGRAVTHHFWSFLPIYLVVLVFLAF